MWVITNSDLSAKGDPDNPRWEELFPEICLDPLQPAMGGDPESLPLDLPALGAGEVVIKGHKLHGLETMSDS